MQRQKRHRTRNRFGAAAVEAAIVLPIIILTLVGGVDVAQYINLGQLVSNASREGANVACRESTTSVSEVELAVQRYFEDWFPSDSENGFGDALEVTVRTVNDHHIPSGDLTQIDSGDFLRVEVSFDFSSIRWFSGPDYWNSNEQEVTTYCRRQ